MLEMILERKILFVLLGGMTAIGVLSKVVANVALKRLVHAAGNMNKSNHPLMRLVRAKFEHACMISDKVVNVQVFVDKYLYEYRVLGIKLHSWRRMEKAAAGLCLLIGVGGATLEYMVNGMQEMVIRTGATGGVLAVLIYLFHLTTDESYRLEGAKTYMVDYLENVCLHKFEKTVTKELKVMAPESPVPDFGVVREEAVQAESKNVQKPEIVPEIVPEKVPEIMLQPKPEMVPQPTPQPEILPEPKIESPIESRIESRMESKKTAMAAKKEEIKEAVKAKDETKKDILIRQILEEFMA